MHGLRHGLWIAALALAACGKSPPADDVRAAIERNVRGASGDPGGDVRAITIGDWREEERAGARSVASAWTARLRLDEAAGAIVATLGGTMVVVTLAAAGDELAFEGRVVAEHVGDHWEIDATTTRSAWTERLERAGRPAGSGVRALARLGDHVEAGSAQEATLRESLVAAERAAEIARLRAALAVVTGEHGAIVERDRETAFGLLITATALDVEAQLARGTGVDLRALPLREVAVEFTADDRGGRTVLAMTERPGGARTVLGEGGVTVRALHREERAVIDRFVARANEAGSAAAIVASVEILDAIARSAREEDAPLVPVVGLVVLGGRAFPQGRPILATRGGELRTTNWTRDALVVRVTEPIQASGIWLRGSKLATGPVAIVVNGVHRAQVDAIPAGGAALITWPEPIDVTELRLEAVEAMSSQGVFLVR